MKLALLPMIFCALAFADLAAIKNEPNAEKRSDLALQNADAVLTKAREAYQAGDDKAMLAALDEVTESVDLTKSSLDESGKSARKHPKYFKKAEMGIRALLRRLDTFRSEVSVEDRPPVDKVIHRAQNLQEEILQLIMGKK